MLIHSKPVAQIREGYIEMSDIPDIKTESQLVTFVKKRFPSIGDVYDVEMFNYRFCFTYTLDTTDTKTIGDVLFNGMDGCSSHDCLINDNQLGTNSSCKCLLDMSRGQLAILSSKLQSLKNKEITL